MLFQDRKMAITIRAGKYCYHVLEAISEIFLSLSPVNFMSGNMGIANAQRTLYYIRVLTEFISQPEYRDLVPIFGIINEALVGLIGIDSMTSFYLEAHTMIRNITGKGEGHGPVSMLHFLTRLDVHQVYLVHRNSRRIPSYFNLGPLLGGF